MSQEEIQIPNGWELKKLGDSDVSEIIMGQSPPSSTYNTEQKGLPFFQGKKDFGENFPITRVWCTKPKKIAKEGDILISVRAPVGSTNWAKEECCIGRGLSAIRVKIEPEYVYYFIKSLENKLSKSGTGSVFNSIGKNDLYQISLPIPSSKTQKKIIQKLDHILGQLKGKKIEILSLIERNKERIDFFEKNWRMYIITNNLENHPLRKKWKQVTFDDVSTKITYGFTNPMPHVEEGRWLITAKNIKNGKINYFNAKKTDLKSFNEKITDKSRPKIDTILITKDGTLGRVGVVDKEGICINQSVGSLEPIQSKILPRFLAFVLESSELQSKISDENKQSTIGHIQITKLAKWTLLLPSLTIQKEIIQNIKNAEEKFKEQKTQFGNIKQNYELKIKYINHIQSSILDSAFTGKLVN